MDIRGTAYTILVASSLVGVLGFSIVPSSALGSRYVDSTTKSNYHVFVAATTPAWISITPLLGKARRTSACIQLMSASDESKGFGKAPKVSRKAAKKTAKKTTQGDAKTVGTEPVADVVEEVMPTASSPSTGEETRKVIEKLEKEKADRKAKQMERINAVMAAKEATKDDPNAGIIPEAVSNRMLKRMVPFFLLPVFGGVGVFVIYFVLAKNYDFEVQPSTVALTTQLPFLIALLGITYAIVSASWDEEREGSFLGFEEAKVNLGNILAGLRRSSDRMDVEDAMLEAKNATKGNRFERRQKQREGSDDGDDILP